MISREDVLNAYAVLLGRAPENEAAIELYSRKPTLIELGAAIRKSAEFRYENALDAPRFSSLSAQAPEEVGGAVAENLPRAALSPSLTRTLASYGFGRGSQMPTLLDGWSAPEPDLCWTVGDASELEIAVPAHGKDETVGITIRVRPFHHPQRLSVSTSGITVLDAKIDRTTVVALTIPQHLIADREMLRLRIEHPDWGRPCDCTTSTDQRELAIEFTRLDCIASPGVDMMSDVEVVRHFESLGDNCEFGFVQRRCGYEPLGLFRFNGIKMLELVRLLSCDFGDFPDRQKVRVEGHKTRKGTIDHIVFEDGYGINGHTQVGEDLEKNSLADPAVLNPQFLRLKMLTRMTQEQIQEGEIIFVFRRMPEPDLAEVMALWLALRSIGPATLLWVVEAKPDMPAGTVAVLQDGLLKGFVARLAPYSNAEDVDLASWLTVCRRAIPLRQSVAASA